MVEFSDLYKEIQNHGISLYQYNVGKSRSATIELNKRYGIFIDATQFSSLAETKRVIAHEVGHCVTGCTHKVSSSIDLVVKHEYKANRWAVKRFLPFEKIQAAVQDGYTEPWQLAEYFDVPETAIKWALHYYIEDCGMSFSAK
ncbi:MAG: ImmA/IrrE family metallo-endopeptidase [Clostridiales bacterium]|jgi:Zn-dependent peptidase ImmA (M78 family)|nr:ImmA/IrrE family metallo-endopeptidase [Clostridiales bacterium]MCI1960943.1 ImmA/IrrE family metallo-endopeptidase [Clostridiales bacterium]MCI2021384.1 ImmA/IrrE family metallo-endopeptidase [Clostridiales bacterium]MCI2025767.1 ImmA/IrrE family metallo-endopeptidase [Clostridiales bacterium]